MVTGGEFLGPGSAYRSPGLKVAWSRKYSHCNKKKNTPSKALKKI
jgi:hypothetical protein